MEWSEEAISQLRGLWLEGHSTAEIGRRMGITKNAVVGKAHRLKLLARPSPIRREGRTDIARPRQAPRADRHVATATAVPASRPMPVAVTSPPPLRSIAKPAPTYGRVLPCCWPIGEPGTPTFRFCDAETMPSKPYCQEHAQLAYVRVRDKRDTAA